MAKRVIKEEGSGELVSFYQGHGLTRSRDQTPVKIREK